MNHVTDALPQPGERLFSLDFYRGFTMFLLIAESTHLFDFLVAPSLQGSFIASIGEQFHHHPWNGLRFWDLVQPFFMFIVGVAMPFSFGRRWAKGDSWDKSFRHTLYRSFMLLFLGWALYCIGPGRITFELWNVLAQLSVTYLIAFLLIRKSFNVQLGVTAALLLLSELFYRFWPVPGFDQPFMPDANFGAYVDMLLMGKLSQGHWVAFNAIPTTAHTVWGVLAGQLLMSRRNAADKIKRLLIAGAIGIILGYALDPLTPIIKRICTSSFVIVSGGWCLVALAFSYWLADVRKVRAIPKFFAIVGMNPLFIYLFAETKGTAWLHHLVIPFSGGLFGWLGELPLQIITAAILWMMLWYMCYFLYQRKIFIKI